MGKRKVLSEVRMKTDNFPQMDMKNKLCKRDYQPKIQPILKEQSNRVTLRSDSTQTAGYTVRAVA